RFFPFRTHHRPKNRRTIVLMRYLFRLLLLCFGLTLMSCTGVVMISRAQPPPPLSPNLQRCADGVPRYMYIVLGQTTWNEAKRMISTWPRWELYRGSFAWFKPNEPSDNVNSLYVLPAADSIVQEIDLEIVPMGVNAGDVITQLGAPCAVISRSLDD